MIRGLFRRLSVQKRIDKVNRGALLELIAGLSDESAVVRMVALNNCIEKKVYNDEIIQKLHELKTDGTYVYGYSISQMAYVLLDISGKEPHIGTDERIISVIASCKEIAP